jgi:Flp pilus assembly pilin Flp
LRFGRRLKRGLNCAGRKFPLAGKPRKLLLATNQRGTDVKRIYGSWKDESGATAIEYGLLAAAAVKLVGSNMSSMFNTVAGHLT